MLIEPQEIINDIPGVSDERVSRPRNQSITSGGKQAIVGESMMVEKLPAMYNLARENNTSLVPCSFVD